MEKTVNKTERRIRGEEMREEGRRRDIQHCSMVEGGVSQRVEARLAHK